MKKGLLILLMQLSFFSCINKSGDKNQIETLKGILLEGDDSSFVNCGTFRIVVAMKFKNYKTEKNFVCIISCPDMYGKNFFIKDHLYNIRLATNDSLNRNEPLSNPYQNENMKTYFAKDIEKLN